MTIGNIKLYEENKKVPPYFYFNTAYGDFFDELSNEEAGKVIKYICDYVREKDNLPTCVGSGASAMVIKIIRQDIDRAFKKYHAQCENGKKGGAPKGNQNASKKKQETPVNKSEILNFKFDEMNNRTSYTLIDIIYFQSEKTEFNINEYFKLSQIAEITACYCICEIEDFKEFELEYFSLKAFTLNENAVKVCKVLKEVAKKITMKKIVLLQFSPITSIVR